MKLYHGVMIPENLAEEEALWHGWYCKYHPSGEEIANNPDRTHCWACGNVRPGSRKEVLIGA